MSNLDSIQKIGIGLTGFVGSNVTASVVETVSVPISDWTSALTQVVIALATLVSLFRKKRRG